MVLRVSRFLSMASLDRLKRRRVEDGLEKRAGSRFCFNIVVGFELYNGAGTIR